MKNAKFTQGPWCQDSTEDTIFILGGPNDTEIICAVETNEKYHSENFVGNANMISAAPDLYVSAVRLLEQLNRTDSILGVAVKPLADKLCLEISRLELAVRKATGDV